MQYALASLVGKVRKTDEDSVLVVSKDGISEGMEDSSTFAAVADGMGGGERGEVASRIAIRSIEGAIAQIFFQDATTGLDIEAVMSTGFSVANSEVRAYSRKHHLQMVGTTLTAFFLSGNVAIVGNVGDSRTCVFGSGGEMKFKTRDHSYIQELVDTDVITGEEARSDPRRNVLTKAIGSEPSVSPDFYRMVIEKGDSILLCCDGLWESIDDRELGRLVSRTMDVDLQVNSIAQLANERDGSDNISLVLLKA